MSDIPSELLSIIFYCVPPESLNRVRCVCKAWCRLIDDPYFIQTHTAKWNCKDTSNIHLLRLKYNDPPLLLSLNSFFNYDDDDDHVVNSMQFNPLRIPNTLWSYRSKCLICNGLILIQRYIGPSSWSIFNPLTQDFYDLPWLTEKNQRSTISKNIAIGFGYDCSTNDYKIVTRDDCYGNQKFGTFIYSLNSKSREKIDIVDFISVAIKNRGVFCNGALHWLGKSENTIVAFDLKSKEIRHYSIPKIPELEVYEHTPELHELGGRLSLSRYMSCQRSRKSISQIWLMDKYGDESSWSGLYSYSMKLVEGNFKPLSLSATKEFLLLEKSSSSFLFVNLKHNTVKTLKIPTGHFEEYSPEICMFRPSLVRITKEEQTIKLREQQQITTGNIKLKGQHEILKERKLKKKRKIILI